MDVSLSRAAVLRLSQWCFCCLIDHVLKSENRRSWRWHYQAVLDLSLVFLLPHLPMRRRRRRRKRGRRRRRRRRRRDLLSRQIVDIHKVRHGCLFETSGKGVTSWIPAFRWVKTLPPSFTACCGIFPSSGFCWGPKLQRRILKSLIIWESFSLKWFENASVSGFSSSSWSVATLALF